MINISIIMYIVTINISTITGLYIITLINISIKMYVYRHDQCFYHYRFTNYHNDQHFYQNVCISIIINIIIISIIASFLHYHYDQYFYHNKFRHYHHDQYFYHNKFINYHHGQYFYHSKFIHYHHDQYF